MVLAEHVLRKFHHCTFDPKIPHFISKKFLWPFFSHRPLLRSSTLYGNNISWRPFFTISPQNLTLGPTYLKKSDDFFLVLALFWTRWWLLFPILLYTHAYCFSRFYTLLCALVTINAACAIYLFLVHHCTNSLSSLHIFVHYCTFCASLHTKTSPGFWYLTKLQ